MYLRHVYFNKRIIKFAVATTLFLLWMIFVSYLDRHFLNPSTSISKALRSHIQRHDKLQKDDNTYKLSTKEHIDPEIAKYYQSLGYQTANFGKIIYKPGTTPIATYDKLSNSKLYQGTLDYEAGKIQMLCETQSRFQKITNCRVKDLYYQPIDNTWHLFIPDIILSEYVRINTGIGGGSPVLNLEIHNCTFEEIQWTRNATIVTGKTALVSVMYENLFRILYAAAGVFHSFSRFGLDISQYLHNNDISKEGWNSIGGVGVILNDHLSANVFFSVLKRIFTHVTFTADIKGPMVYQDVMIGFSKTFHINEVDRDHYIEDSQYTVRLKQAWGRVSQRIQESLINQNIDKRDNDNGSSVVVDGSNLNDTDDDNNEEEEEEENGDNASLIDENDLGEDDNVQQQQQSSSSSSVHNEQPDASFEDGIGGGENQDIPKQPTITFVSRRSKVQARKILNEKELIKAIEDTYNVKVNVYDFQIISFDRQLEIVRNTDIYIGVHGAAISHVANMRPGTTIVEIFPYGFRKRVYENLAQLLDIKYISIQNYDYDKTVFHSELLEEDVQMLSLTPQQVSDITSKHIDWLNPLSKSYWRNQDFELDVKSFLQHVRVLFEKSTIDNYLVYMPWEGLGKQLDAFKNACGIASLLQRTLVLPKLGGTKYRFAGPKWNFKYRVFDYIWSSFEDYFQIQNLQNMPCNVMTHDNFLSYANLNGTIAYSTPAPYSRNKKQLFNYYNKVIRIGYSSIKLIRNQMYEQDILDYWSNDKERVLALGSTIMIDPFHERKSDTRPLLDIPMYRHIVKNLVIRRDITTLVDQVTEMKLPKDFNVVYVRTDFKTRCSIVSKKHQSRCNPKKDTVTKNVESYKMDELPIYISSNRAAKEVLSDEYLDMSVGLRKYYYGDFDKQFEKKLDEIPLNKPHTHRGEEYTDRFDPILSMLGDILLGVKARLYLGNKFSSFSAQVREQRDLVGKKSFYYY